MTIATLIAIATGYANVDPISTGDPAMRIVHIDSLVRLKDDVPDQGRRRGETGVVLSVWLIPGDLLYEVGFRNHNGAAKKHILLRADQLEVVE